ncbi:uncharacterized protein LOC129912297 isoform X2 [Episyrphus balteatus]|uniref:uncharacterized protein LOC129912297 isoform X2 n=1 Tax=Episyrphus balteatus TaxID=286459 RepID=UPI0024850BF8|nr:uncharacterized protein LOC129912297 isoform X2 [Episyrphus balteatus]
MPINMTDTVQSPSKNSIKRAITPIISHNSNNSPLAVQKFEGLPLEPPTKDLVVDYGNDDDESCDTEAITKEEEWITKKKTELTTTRQIETRVKRQVVLEDGKVIEDSGPIVSTNTTEDTDKQETETTERRDLGSPKPLAIESGKDEVDNGTVNQLANPDDKQLDNFSGTVIQKFVPRPADGLVREINEKRVVSREEIKDRLETEDVRHLGDFSDEAYVNAVNSGAENIETILYSPESQKQLVPTGPRVIQQSTKGHKTIDTEDIQQRSLAQADGTLVTEKKNTTEHEEIFDEELPEKDDNSTGSKEKIFTTESSQRFLKQRDEQEVEFVVDGKVISKEMRYAAETEQMERDGAPDRPGDWDSLSARIRKAKRAPKTLLQQQKEAALLSDRKDALTKRPLDFDREEETRKGETMKWLESHFGSESTASNDSRDDYQEIEPTKKTYFNVTIKSNPTTPPNVVPVSSGLIHSVGKPARVIVADHDLEKGKTYFQGISNWADRKESTPKHFATKAFRDELKGTLDSRNRIKQNASREDLSTYYPKESAARNETYVTREDILQQKRQYNSRSDLRYRSSSREDLVDMKNIRSQKEDLGYLSGSRTDVRYHRPDSTEENMRNLKNAKNASYLKREDSGYVKDSSEDVTSSNLRCDGEDDVRIVAEKYRSGMMVQDDSAYVSSPTYFNENRLPKSPEYDLGSPSSEIVSHHDTTLSRPAVPQRRRGIEKKVRQQPAPIVAPKFHHRDEPPPDYSPPPQSRSASPAQTRYNAPPPPAITPYTGNPANMSTTANGVSSRKSNQRTRFASESSSASQHQMRPSMSTQTTQTSPPSAGGGGNSSNKQSSTKVGQAIGNSFRKLVGKIRSASAERKFRMKSKSKSRDKSPINGGPPSPNGGGMSTYQQYNVIDSHIGGGNGGSGGVGQAGSSTVTTTSSTQPSNNTHHSHSHHHSQLQQRNSAPINRESSVVSSSTAVGRDSRPTTQTVNGNQYANSAENRRGSSDLDVMGNPKQRYYLGEDPYAGGLFGKENKYDAGAAARRARESRDTIDSNYPRENSGPVTVAIAPAAPPPSSSTSQYHRSRRAGSSDENREIYVQRNITSNTLGRFQKNNHRIGSTPDLNYDYRSAHTLPRKLDNHHRTPTSQPPQHHSSKINVSIVNQLKPPQNTGPAKPARTYKTLNRSKSFNVHGLNGTNDPSPIYIEKLTKNNYSNNSAIGSSSGNMYKSNPHLYVPENAPLQSGLKSPSIVNLISRSQKDLTRIDETDRHYSSNLGERRFSSTANNYTNGNESKRNVFLEGLRDQAPDLYKTLHGDEPDLASPPSRNVYKYSHLTGKDASASPLRGGSRSPAVEIIRRGSSSTEDYSETYKYSTRSDDPNRPLVTDTVQTFSKKTIPARDGRGVETIQSSERQSVTKSHQYRSDPMPKYIDEQKRRNFGNVGGSTIIEVRRK